MSDAELDRRAQLGAEERERRRPVSGECDAQGAEGHCRQHAWESTLRRHGAHLQRTLTLERAIDAPAETEQPARVEPDPDVANAVRICVVRRELLRRERVHHARTFLDVAGIAEITLAEQPYAEARGLPLERGA